jgi:hypothetical protein
LKKFPDDGETDVRIKFGKIVKNNRGGREGGNIVSTTVVKKNISKKSVKNGACTVLTGEVLIDCKKSTERGSAHALNCFFVNARGLLSKMDLLRNYALTMKLDIIV